MTSKLIQLLSDDYEALFRVPGDTTEEEIRKYWTDYSNYDDTSEEGINFEDYMDEFHPDANFERQFVDEIYLDTNSSINKCYLCKETEDNGAKLLVEGDRYVCTNCLTNR